MVFEALDSIGIEDRLRVRLFSWASGLLLALGWWLFIDACVQNGQIGDQLGIKPQIVLLPVGSTLAFFVVACIDQSSLNADEYSHHSGRLVRLQARALFGFAVILLIICAILSAYVLSHVYIQKNGIKGKIPDSNYPGWSILSCCFFILIGTALVKIGRVSDDFF